MIKAQYRTHVFNKMPTIQVPSILLGEGAIFFFFFVNIQLQLTDGER